MTSSSPQPLTPAQIGELAQRLPLWTVVDGNKAIRRALKFADFRRAFDFMTEVAAAADAADHHPDWSNSYNRVVISLSTHDAGGLSERDVQLADTIDAASARFGGA